MLGAAVYDLYKNRAILSVENATIIAIGFVVAFFFLRAVRSVRTLVGFCQPPRLRASSPGTASAIGLVAPVLLALVMFAPEGL